MKEVLALCIALSFIAISVQLMVQKSIDWKGFCVITGAALLLGFLIVRHQEVTRLSMWKFGVETATGQIQAVKLEALKEIEVSTAEHREQLATLFRQGNSLTDQLEAQKIAIDNRIEEAKKLEQKLEFAELRSKALAGRRSAFEKLLELSNDGGDQASTLDAIEAVKRRYEATQLGLWQRITFDHEGKTLNAEDVPIDVLIKLWPGNGPTERMQILHNIRANGDALAIPFVLDVLKTEEDLEVCAVAVVCLEKLTGKDSERLDFKYWLSGQYKE